jgi:hypothetical protein
MRGTKYTLRTTELPPKVVSSDAGRTDNPELIAWFRNLTAVEATSGAEVADRVSRTHADIDEHDSLGVAKGVVVGLLVSVALWTVIGFTAWCLL